MVSARQEQMVEMPAHSLAEAGDGKPAEPEPEPRISSSPIQKGGMAKPTTLATRMT